MKVTIPIKEVCKSDLSGRPKLKTDTAKLNKWILRIIRATKKDVLYELGFDKKKAFIERLIKVTEKYKTLNINVEKI